MNDKNEQNKKLTKEEEVKSPKNLNKKDNDNKELTLEEKLEQTEEKLLRSLAEIENQRRRFEKEIKDAFEFGSFNFAKESLAILDNLQRAKDAIKNDDKLKNNKDLDKFLENINIIEKDLISIFEKIELQKLKLMKKNLTLISIRQCLKLKMTVKTQVRFFKKFSQVTC